MATAMGGDDASGQGCSNAKCNRRRSMTDPERRRGASVDEVKLKS